MVFFNKLQKQDTPEPVNGFDEETVREFCQIILMGEHEHVTEQCVKLITSNQIDLEALLYILSGYDTISGCDGKILYENSL